MDFGRTPVAGVPGWHADPAGAHDHRWWDGTAFTDQVANGGVVSTDAGRLGPPVAPAPEPAPGLFHPPSSAAAPAPPAAPPSRALPLLLVILGALAIAGAAAWYLLLRDDGSSGTGDFAGTIDDDTPSGVHEVSLAAGSAVTVEVEPDRQLDAVVAFVVSEDDADRLDDLYEDLGIVEILEVGDAFGTIDGDELDQLGEDRLVVFRTDVGFAGDDEQLLLAVPFDLELQVFVAPFEAGDEGDYRITIETLSLDVEDIDAADGEELLAAVSDDDDTPNAFRDLSDDLLAGLD